jgi:LPXTG-motif cell wall-anchored protein
VKKKLLLTGVALAGAALLAVGSVAPAFAAVNVVDSITMGGGTDDYYGNVAVSNDGSLIAVAFEYGGLSIYDVATGTSRDISEATLGASDIGYPAFSPDNAFLYVATYDTDEIIVVDLSDDSVDRTISGMSNPWAVTASQDGAYLYVHSFSSGDVWKVTLATDTVSSALDVTGDYGVSMCLTSDGATLYSPTYSGNSIAVVDTATMTITSQLTGPNFSNAFSCTWDNDGNLIVGLSHPAFGKVVKVDPLTQATTASADGSALSTYGAAASCDTIYSAGYYDLDISAIDLATMSTGTAVVPNMNGSPTYYWSSAARNLDGSVVAIGGYSNVNGLVIITSDECPNTVSGGGGSGGSGDSGAPELANTGIDSTVAGVAAGMSALVVLAGVVAIVAIRRRNA